MKQLPVAKYHKNRDFNEQKDLSKQQVTQDLTYTAEASRVARIFIKKKLNKQYWVKDKLSTKCKLQANSVSHVRMTRQTETCAR